jgi:RNA polymerase sigma-70 factor (ECF subfamily)
VKTPCTGGETHVNEAEQVTRAQEGDEVAWGHLVRRHQEAVFRLAYLLLHDANDAEDVTQETFLRAYRALNRFDVARPLRPWLLEITRNQSYNWSRALRRRLAALQRWGYHTQDASVGTPQQADTQPEEEALRQWKATALWQAVRRLHGMDQEVVYLRCFMELSVEETAQVLKVAPGTVKSRLSRALERLRRVVEQDFPGLRENVTDEEITGRRGLE